MKRRAVDPGPEISGWAIPYGDFLTLMLAVFIAMYAVSQVNGAKYHALAASLGRAFHGSAAAVPRPALPLAPIIATRRALSAGARRIARLPVPPKDLAIPLPVPLPQRLPRGAVPASTDPALQRISGDVARALQPWVARGAVTIQRDPSWIAISIRADVLFPEGTASLSPGSQGVLAGVGKALAGFGNAVRIEGYTDDLPIHTARFPSNWELSAARAARVARLFGAAGVAPARLGIVGWGADRPAADNATAAGRARNRRIVVMVLAAGAQARLAMAPDPAGAAGTGGAQADVRLPPRPSEQE